MNPPGSSHVPPLTLPIRFFILGIASLVVFGISLPIHGNEILAQHHYTQHTVALTHVLALGWIGSVIMGAMLQMTPIILSVKLQRERQAGISFWFHATGLAVMIVGFWIWDFRVVMWGGTLLMIGFFIFWHVMFQTFRQVPKHGLVSIHLMISQAYMIATFLAGQYLMHDKVMTFSPFHVLSAIHAHAHLAFIGWFVILLMGVSYHLLPMFLVSNIQSSRRAWLAFALVNLGLPLLFASLLLQKPWVPLAATITSLGLGFWMWEMVVIFKKRARVSLDPSLRHIHTALLHLPAILGLGIWLSWPVEQPRSLEFQAQTAYGLLALLGLLSLFILCMLYKIIPFLVWFHVYSPQVGIREVPRLQDLFSARLQNIGLPLFILGIWTTSLAALFSPHLSSWMILAATWPLVIGIMIHAINLLRPLRHLPISFPKIHWPKCPTHTAGAES